MGRKAHSGKRSMRCMEIRGGNLAVEESFEAPGLDEWVYSRPHQSSAGGGDVHYVSLCGGGIVSRLILADVSGHGSAVSEVGASLRTLMRKNINVKNQGRLLRDLNRQFAEVARLNWFATAVVATYLAGDRTLTISNAGHPRPLLRRASSGDWEFAVGRDLLQAVADYRMDHEADDDLTLVAWRHNGGGPRHPSLAEKIDVYAKVFGLKRY